MTRQLNLQGVVRTALLPGEIGVDLFAGGGGWSEGFQRAVGMPPAVAVNHDKHAIEMHRLNHPESEHHHEDVFEVDPHKATRGRPVGWLHLSPDCTHFSRAKGSKPKSKKIRGLAWVGVNWAAAVSPRIISLENVSEFVTWGPLHQQGPLAGQPNKRLAGTTFRKFVSALEALGYEVQWRVLNAAEYGAPTSRKRLFIIARRDGLPIVWPNPTYGPGRSKPFRTAAECIDWSIAIPSIFDRKKPLADATLRRIAEGIRRYVLENPRPFLVNLTHGARLESLEEPFRTLTAAHRGEKALVAPTLVQTGYGERDGQRPRTLDLHQPLGTIVGGGQKHALVAAMLKHYGGVVGQEMERPLGTITATDHHSVLAAHIVSHYGESTGRDINDPLPTITAGGMGHAGLVAAFLAKYYGSDRHGQALTEPLHTVPTVDRFGLVTISIDGESYALADIGMRMLQPRELARAQGFPDSYILTGNKTAQVARIGNSVPPVFPDAIVRANLLMEAAA